MAEVKVASLEERSKNSRARVHYHKFTRGKDLSRYSEKDLANILGKKTLTQEEKPEVVEEEPPQAPEQDSSGPLIINTGISIMDYFKKKKESKNTVTEIQSADSGISESGQEAEIPKKKKKKSKDRETDEQEIQDISTPVEEENIPSHEPAEETREKKKSKKIKAPNSEIHEMEAATEKQVCIPLEEETPETIKQKRKKSKKPQQQISETQNDFQDFVSESTVVEESKNAPEEKKEITDALLEVSIKKKKSKKTQEAYVQEEQSKVAEEASAKKKKSKKLKNHKETIDLTDSIIDDAPDNSQECEKTPQKPDKSKRKRSNVTDAEPSVNVDLTLDEETPQKKKKKKSKTSDTSETVDLTTESGSKVLTQEPEGAEETAIDTTIIVGEHPNTFFLNVLAVEKLKNLKLDKFAGSNVANIVGYGLRKDLKLQVNNSSIVKGTPQLNKYSVYVNVDRAHSKKYAKTLLLRYHKKRNSFKL